MASIYPHDEIIFAPQSVGVEKVKEGRAKFVTTLKNARISNQVDVDFVDAVIPSLLQYPTVLSMQAPQIQPHPMETVIAEKMEAIASLGMLSTE